MFSSSPVVIRYLCFFAHRGVQYILCFAFLRLVYPMLPVSLDCSFFIALSVFWNVHLSCVLSTLCCQFLWIANLLLPFLYSLTFICPVFCLPYVASFSGLFIFYCPFGILERSFVLCLVYPMLPVYLDCSCFIALSVVSNIHLSCVLSTLCCQFIWIVHVLLPCQ